MHKILSPNFPFPPKRFPFFYGWIVLAVSTMAVVMSVPGQTIGVSVFTDSLMEVLGLSRVELSIAYMIGTVGSALLLPRFGLWFDKTGARFMVVLSTLLLGGTLLLLSQCDRIAKIITFGREGTVQIIAGFLTVTAGFMLIRFSGQGLLCMSARSMLGKWFNRRRGLVSGIHGVAVTFSFSIAPLAFDKIMRIYGWRGTWMVLSAIVGGLTLIGWLFSRDNPEECGLLMDGDSDSTASDTGGKEKYQIKKEFTVQEARKTFSFWIFNLGLAAQALIITAITFHIVSIGEQMGLNREESLAVFLPMSMVSIGSNFLFGWLSDYVKLKYCLVIMMITLALGVGGMPFFAETTGRYSVIFGLGASTGVFGPLITVVWPKYFGRLHLGAISSLNLSSMVFASAIGPFIFGLSYEWYGTYQTGIYFCLLMPLLLLFAAFKANNPQTE